MLQWASPTHCRAPENPSDHQHHGQAQNLASERTNRSWTEADQYDAKWLGHVEHTCCSYNLIQAAVNQIRQQHRQQRISHGYRGSKQRAEVCFRPKDVAHSCYTWQCVYIYIYVVHWNLVFDPTLMSKTLLVDWDGFPISEKTPTCMHIEMLWKDTLA